jgi:hypothetical protein
VVRGNLLILIIQQLTCVPGAGAEPYQLAVLPTPFPVDSGTGPPDGARGPAGLPGSGGAGGTGPQGHPGAVPGKAALISVSPR